MAAGAMGAAAIVGGGPGTAASAGSHDGRAAAGSGAAIGGAAGGGIGRQAWPSHQYAPSGEICGGCPAIGAA